MNRPSHGKGMEACRAKCEACLVETLEEAECTRLHKRVGKLWTHQCMARHVWIVRNEPVAIEGNAERVDNLGAACRCGANVAKVPTPHHPECDGLGIEGGRDQ